MRVALVQLSSSDDPAANLPGTERLVREAAAGGARLVLTPEVTNIVSTSRRRQQEVLRREANDPTLARLREVAAETGIWLSIGSLALLADEPEEERFVNRQFLVSPDGHVDARYDKIHMFDVELGGEERYRESTGYRPGTRAIRTKIELDGAEVHIGLTTCYDMRFPHLYRALAKACAEVITVPSAFTVQTGPAHWEVLLRARAIETGCFVLAAAQWGTHAASTGRARQTYGHSLAVDPWGRVLADAGEGVGVTLVDLDLAAVEDARRKIPSLWNDRDYEPPVHSRWDQDLPSSREMQSVISRIASGEIKLQP